MTAVFLSKSQNQFKMKSKNQTEIRAFIPPTTYEGAMKMVTPLNPDEDWSTANKYAAFERLKLFFSILFSE